MDSPVPALTQAIRQFISLFSVRTTRNRGFCPLFRLRVEKSPQPGGAFVVEAYFTSIAA